MKEYPDMAVVYKITCMPNNKVYVGSTRNPIKRRWQAHKDTLRKGIHHSKRFQHSWNMYGETSFSFEVLEQTDEPKILEREQFWIDFYKAADPIYGFNNMSMVMAGHRRTNNKLEEKDVLEILHAINEGQKRTEIAEKFKISPSTVCDIRFGRSWGYINRGVNLVRFHPPAKISDKTVEEIKKYAKEGFTHNKIANLYNINQSTVSRIVTGKRRKKIVYKIVA